MSSNKVPIVPWIARPNEYERLVTDLIDQRFFGPVAITTSLVGARGMGKTRLAKEVCCDPRVIEAFPDGIFWVTLGESLSPLELLSRMERLAFDLTGEQRGLTDLRAAEAHLHRIIHPRKVLLVLDEANDAELVRPFLHTGPCGGTLIITYNDESLPLGTRRTHVDIMMTGEALALLAAGLGDPAAGQFEGEPAVDTLLAGLSNGAANDQESEPSIPADSKALASIKKEMNRQWAARVGLPAEMAVSLSDLAGRLNEWPLLLVLVNAMLRHCLVQDDLLKCQNLGEALSLVEDRLQHCGLDEIWPVTNAAARDKALNAVITACLEPLSDDSRERLYELAVFTRLEEIPLAAVSVLWEKSETETRAACELLAGRALLFFDPTGGMIHLHPALQEFILDNLRAGVLADLHARIVDGYACRCREEPDSRHPEGWATGPDDGYFFQHLAGHLAASGRLAELQALLFQFRWLSAYLSCTSLLDARRGDLYSLLIDYELALSTALDQQSAELRLVQDALRLAAPILARNPGQIATQLLGRLLSFQEPGIQALLNQAMAWTVEPWLRPLSVCFSQPGSDEVHVLSGHTDWVTGMAMLPGGQHAVSSSLDGSLRVWDLASGKAVRVLAAYPDGISAMGITPDGLLAVTTGWDGLVRVWELSSGEEVLQFRAHDTSIGALVVTPDGRRIVTGADDHLIRVWDCLTGQLQMEMVGHGDLVRSLAVSPDCRTLISGSWDSTVRAWDLETGRQMHFMTGHNGWVPAVAISPDGFYGFSGGWDRTLRIWDLWTGELAGKMEGFGAPVTAIGVLPGGKELLAGTGEGVLHLLRFEPGEEPAAADRQPAGSSNGSEKVPPARLPPHEILTGHTGGINAILLTKQGRFAITASDDGTLRVWDLVAAQGAAAQPGHSAPVFALENLPGSSCSLSGSWDGTLKLWDLTSGALLATLSGHSGGIVALAVSADGRRAISGSRDHTLRVWELPGGRELFSLSGHAGAITSVSITPDGRRAVSGADDGTLRVWDLEKGGCLAEFRGEKAIWSCAIAGDGQTIVAGESSGKLFFLEIRG